MIEFINSWAQQIIVAVVIATIIEIIVPEGNNKKYIKMVVGIYILFTIISPLINKIGNDKINLDSIITSTEKELDGYNTEKLEINTNVYIENTYKEKIRDEIKNTLQEKNYKVVNISMKIETKNESNYGLINSLYIKVSKNDEENKINNTNTIQKVNIELSNNMTNTNEELIISEDDIEELKSYLSEEYSIEKDNITIEC